jgi:quinol monooxygenase YgiN
VIKRIVKLTFDPEKTGDFLAIFEEMKLQIRGFEGCNHLELWRSRSEPNVFFTYSLWDTEAHLDAYRHSELFQDTWRRTKALFVARPEAWSVEAVG